MEEEAVMLQTSRGHDPVAGRKLPVPLGESGKAAAPRRGLAEGFAATAPIMTALIGLFALRSAAEAGEATAGQTTRAPGGEPHGADPTGPVGGGNSGGVPAGAPLAGGLSSMAASGPAGGLLGGLIPSAAAAEIEPATGGLAPGLVAGAGSGPAPLMVPIGRSEGASAGPTSMKIEAQVMNIDLPSTDLEPIDEQPADPIGDVDTGTDDGERLTGTPLADRLEGGEGDDIIEGLAGNDVLLGGNGDDHLSGGPGDDILEGGDGVDELQGGEGIDHLEGKEGDDRLFGGAGRDELFGGAGDDYLDGGSEGDLLEGGMGDDVLVLHEIRTELIEQPGGGNDTVLVASDFADNFKQGDLGWMVPDGLVTFKLGDQGSAWAPGDVNWYAQQVQIEIENIRLEGADDHDVWADDRDNEIFGNDGDNVLYAGGGDDLLEGGAGADVLYGEEGDDVLAGGDGEDLLYGGAGDDLFVFGIADGGRDVVFDHEGVNALRLDGADPAKLAANLVGSDLELTHDGEAVALIKDYVGHEAHFSTVEAGGSQLAVDDLLAGIMARSAPVDDILDGFIDPQLEPSGAVATSSPDWGVEEASAPVKLLDAGLAAGFATGHDLFQPLDVDMSSALEDASSAAAERLAREQGAS
jgi:hypothetical protein